MALSLFKKPNPTDMNPAREALTSALIRRNLIDHERQVIAGRLIDYRLTLQRTDELTATVLSLHQSIDQRIAESEYRRTESSDVATDTRTLQDLEKKLTTARVAANKAAAVIPKLERDMQSLTETMLSMKPEIDALLRDAVRVDMDSLAPELAAAEEVFRAVYRKVFIRALAYDTLIKEGGVGDKVDASRYLNLLIEKPKTTAFYPTLDRPGTAEAEKANILRDVQAFQNEAADYISIITTGV